MELAFSGYTTFSTYTVDVVTLVHTGRWPLAVGYFVATPALAVLAAAAGAAATRTIAARRGRHLQPARSGAAEPPPSGATSADLRQQRPAGENTEGGGES